MRQKIDNMGIFEGMADTQMNTGQEIDYTPVAGSNRFAPMINIAQAQMKRDTPFAALNKKLTGRKRMEALSAARKEGLSPADGEKYFRRVGELLSEAGDEEGAQRAEEKANAAADRTLDRAGRQASINQSEAVTGQAKATTKSIIAEAAMKKDLHPLVKQAKEDEHNFNVARVEKIQFEMDNTLSPQEAHENAMEIIELEHNLGMERLTAEARQEALEKGYDVDEGMIKVAGHYLTTWAIKHKDKYSDNPLYAQFKNTYGIGIDELQAGMVETDKGKKAAAEFKWRGIATSIAMNVARVKQMTGGRISTERAHRLAMAAGVGRHLVKAPDGNGWLSIPTTYDDIESVPPQEVRRIRP